MPDQLSTLRSRDQQSPQSATRLCRRECRVHHACWLHRTVLPLRTEQSRSRGDLPPVRPVLQHRTSAGGDRKRSLARKSRSLRSCLVAAGQREARTVANMRRKLAIEVNKTYSDICRIPSLGALRFREHRVCIDEIAIVDTNTRILSYICARDKPFQDLGFP